MNRCFDGRCRFDANSMTGSQTLEGELNTVDRDIAALTTYLNEIPSINDQLDIGNAQVTQEQGKAIHSCFCRGQDASKAFTEGVAGSVQLESISVGSSGNRSETEMKNQSHNRVRD